VSALDELRFGPQRTLNLRESLPTAPQAVKRTEAWLREQQVRGTPEVLIITGRGTHSVGGTAVLKPAIEKLLFSLRRRGVVAGHAEHNPGAFVVTLASLRALTEAPRRHREAAPPRASFAFDNLAPETTALLRDLAERSLHALGVAGHDRELVHEMHRQLGFFVPGLPPGAAMESHLQAALRAAIAEYD
jgi:hypothetical protein